MGLEQELDSTRKVDLGSGRHVILRLMEPCAWRALLDQIRRFDYIARRGRKRIARSTLDGERQSDTQLSGNVRAACHTTHLLSYGGCGPQGIGHRTFSPLAVALTKRRLPWG